MSAPTVSTRTHRPPVALHRAAPCGVRQRLARPLPEVVVEPDNADEWRAHVTACALECLELQLLPVHQQHELIEDYWHRRHQAWLEWGRLPRLVQWGLRLTGRRPAILRVRRG